MKAKKFDLNKYMREHMRNHHGVDGSWIRARDCKDIHRVQKRIQIDMED